MSNTQNTEYLIGTYYGNADDVFSFRAATEDAARARFAREVADARTYNRTSADKICQMDLSVCGQALSIATETLVRS